MNWYDMTPWNVTGRALNWGADKVDIGTGVSGVNDWLNDGFNYLIDTNAQQRGLDTLNQGMHTATSNLDASLQPVNKMYQNAMKGRQMGDVLDTYRKNMGTTADAGSAGNVENFMNPMYGKALSGAANQALAGAGSSALSTAGNNSVASAVADKAASMWNTAFQQALADAKNKQGVYSDIEQSDLSPSLGWSQFLSDVTGSKYDAQVAQANAASQVAGQDKGLISGFVSRIF